MGVSVGVAARAEGVALGSGVGVEVPSPVAAGVRVTAACAACVPSRLGETARLRATELTGAGTAGVLARG